MKDIQFKPIHNSPFYAMCGFNKEAYVNIELLLGEYPDENFTIARGVANMIHESAYLIFQYLKGNFAIITPKGKVYNVENDMEAGYRLEYIIFGSIDVTYWNLEDKISDPDFWNAKDKIPIFKKLDLKGLPRRSIPNSYMSGIENCMAAHYE
jgi:hypothetical protein